MMVLVLSYVLGLTFIFIELLHFFSFTRFVCRILEIFVIGFMY